VSGMRRSNPSHSGRERRNEKWSDEVVEEWSTGVVE
jgi:hypothetical protein